MTIRLSDELARWIEQAAARTGLPRGRIVREQLEKAQANAPEQPFLKLAGSVRGPRNLSARKGFSRQ